MKGTEEKSTGEKRLDGQNNHGLVKEEGGKRDNLISRAPVINRSSSSFPLNCPVVFFVPPAAEYFALLGGVLGDGARGDHR